MTQSAFVTQPLFKTKSLTELGGTPSTSSNFTYSKPFESSFSNSALTTGAGKQDYSKYVEPESGFSMPDASAMQGYAGLASSLAQLATLPGQLKTSKLQREGLRENIAQVKADNAFRANVRKNLANYRTGG